MKIRLSAIVPVLLVFSLPSGGFAQEAEELSFFLRGASIYAQDYEKTYLGKLTSEYDPDSIFNTEGSYGSEYSPRSIWNREGNFGAEFSPVSAFNRYTATPPVIQRDGRTLGHLTMNTSIEDGISPEDLKKMKDRF